MVFFKVDGGYFVLDNSYRWLSNCDWGINFWYCKC